MFGTSNQEAEIVDFIKSIYNKKIICNSREIISPKEIDIFLPEDNFAIEYNGLYWHKDDKTTNTYHYDKTMQCYKNNIKLFHIYSDEWLEKKEIVKSMISSRLNLSTFKIHARQCVFASVDSKVAKEFYEKNHISGGDYYKHNFALLKDEKIVSCISFRKPRHIKKYVSHIEIARFANLLNHNIPGSFQKLLKNAIHLISQKENISAILSYCDLRFGDGNVYKISGFEDCGHTGLDYWYTDGKIRIKDYLLVQLIFLNYLL